MQELTIYPWDALMGSRTSLMRDLWDPKSSISAQRAHPEALECAQPGKGCVWHVRSGKLSSMAVLTLPFASPEETRCLTSADTCPRVISAEDVENNLRAQIIDSLVAQGFEVSESRISLPDGLDKDGLRKAHADAVAHRIERAKAGLVRKQESLLSRLANGAEIDPECISPRLVEVAPDSEDELLFRFATMHWSIPVSSGYGRRLRFLVVDEQNDALIGVIGLCDPVFALRERDAWIGWSRQDARQRLNLVIDAFVLGAVPPYSALLCGKLVAMLATSNEVRTRFEQKYAKSSGLISGKELSGQMVLLTTTSALGRSSIYNRLGFRGLKLLESVGFTKGSGDFQFSNGLYKEIRRFALETCTPTAKNQQWGNGFRNRREVIRKALGKLGLSPDWQYHGVAREVFVAPLAQNSKAILQGTETDPLWHDRSADELSSWFKDRWLLPRARRDNSYLQFERQSCAVWPQKELRLQSL